MGIDVQNPVIFNVFKNSPNRGLRSSPDLDPDLG